MKSRILQLSSAVVLFASALAAIAEPTPAPAAKSEPDEVMRQFAECLEVRTRTGPGGRRMTSARDDLLGGLRQLKDPRLKPLFAELAASKRADFRRHGILGLAELADDKRLNVLLVAKLESAPEQASILREAMQANLIAREQISEILAWPGLEPYVELVLRLRQHASGDADPKSMERFKELANSPLAPTCVMAKLCLAQMGEAGQAEEAWQKTMTLEPQPRAALVMLTLEVIRNEKMLKCAPYAIAAAKEYAGPTALFADALRTVLVVAPEVGAAEWLRVYGEAKDLPDRLRCAILALEADEHASPAMCDALEQTEGSALLHAMGAALRAVSTGSPDAPAALAALAAQNYRPSTAWVLERATKLEGNQRVAVARSIIDQATSRRTQGDVVPDVVVPAAASIAFVDPPALLPLIQRAIDQDDDVMVQAILTGALRTGTKPIWDDRSKPRWDDSPTQALAMLYSSRTADAAALEGTKREELRKIASGRGDLPDVFRVQAAWLVLASEGRDREALARVLSAAD